MTLIRRLGLTAALAAGLLALPAAATEPDGVSGPYLAARQAARQNDYVAVARYIDQLLALHAAPSDMMAMAVRADVALGRIDNAVPVAQTMRDQGIKNQVATLILLTDRLAKGDYESVLSPESDSAHIGTLVDGLVAAWANLGTGKMSEAIAAFDKLAKTPGLQAFGLYHKALALASVGDFEGADTILSGATSNGNLGLSRRGIIARAEVLSQLERNPDALKLLNADFEPGSDPGVDALRARLKAGETLPFDVVHNPRDGMAEVFLTVATALDGQASDDFTLVYARIAQYLRPDLTGATLLAAKLLEKQDHQALAIDAYNSVPKDNPSYYIAEMGRAQAIYATGDAAGATEALQRLAKAYPGVMEVQVALGDVLRRQERFREAAAAYDKAVTLIGTPTPRVWGVFYMRGISEERGGNWDKAEADLREALKLNPDQPEVLNYLGYALVDRGEKLDEALKLIQKAVSGRPDDGYIADSLAWALYRLGRYKQALPQMEKASQLMPVDPVVTDHLGDVYWTVGRKLEARFQWSRALSYGPDPKDAVRIRRKLAVGLDAVLKKEGAKATMPAIDSAAAGTGPAARAVGRNGG